MYIEDCCPGSAKNDLRHLVKVIMNRIEAESSAVEKTSSTDAIAAPSLVSSRFKNSCESMLFFLVSEVVGEVVESIELAKSTEHIISCCKVRVI